MRARGGTQLVWGQRWTLRHVLALRASGARGFCGGLRASGSLACVCVGLCVWCVVCVCGGDGCLQGTATPVQEGVYPSEWAW